VAIFNLLKDQSALVLAAIVAVINIIGLFYNYAAFAALDYNYTDFAAFEDFVVAAFKSPLALVYALNFIGLIAWYWIRRASDVDAPEALEQRQVSQLASVIVIYSLVGAAAVPAGVGWMSVRQSEKDWWIFPATSVVEIVCQRSRGEAKVFQGELISEAGDLYLLKAPDGKGVLVSKECVLSITQL